MDKIYIEWCDATEMEYGWSSEEEVKKWATSSNWIVKQCGFVLEDNEKYLTLATRYSPTENSDNMYGGVIKIPKTWILVEEKFDSDKGMLMDFISKICPNDDKEDNEKFVDDYLKGKK